MWNDYTIPKNVDISIVYSQTLIVKNTTETGQTIVPLRPKHLTDSLFDKRQVYKLFPGYRSYTFFVGY